jgi:hypothetical protein
MHAMHMRAVEHTTSDEGCARIMLRGPTTLKTAVELRNGEVGLCPGPMGQYFSGSCTVTSRNPLIHKGATKGTKSPHLEA